MDNISLSGLVNYTSRLIVEFEYPFTTITIMSDSNM